MIGLVAHRVVIDMSPQEAVFVLVDNCFKIHSTNHQSVGGWVVRYRTSTRRNFKYLNAPKYADLVLLVQLRWLGDGRVPGWVTSTREEWKPIL